MKICILNDSWTPLWGGGPEHIWQVASYLVSHDLCTIDIIVPYILDKPRRKYPKAEEYFEGRLRVLRIGPSFVFPSLAGRLAFMLAYFWYCLTHTDYDIYHSQYFSTSVFLWPIKLLTGKKIVFTLHGAAVKGVGAGIFNLIGPVLVNIFLYHIPYDQLETAARSNIDPKHQNIFAVIGNGVNIADFNIQKTLHTKKEFRILWVGREYDPVKGLQYLKEAVNIVRKKYPHVTLKIVSNRPRLEVVKEYFQNDLFILPSLSEGLPLTLLEAMAAKMPVIASSVGDIPEIIQDGKNGYLVPPGNSQQLAAKIVEAIKNPHLQQMGEAGYRLVKEKYTWEQVAKKQYAIYEKLLQK